MPFGQRLVANIPPVILCVVFVSIAVCLSVAGLLLMKRWLSHQKRKVHNDVAGPIFATLGVIYAVLLAFVVVIVWQAFDRANLNVEQEANCLGDLYASAIAFPEKSRVEIRAFLEDYRLAVINQEWPLLHSGQKSAEVNAIQRRIWDFYATYTPATITEEIFLRQSVANLNSLSELRKMRLLEARTGINRVIWVVLIVGGVITVTFSFFFGTENHGVQMIMTVLLAVLIALILFTILEMDYPFTGNLMIKPIAFEHLAIMR